jgi:activator of HSP90 ATPase
MEMSSWDNENQSSTRIFSCVHTFNLYSRLIAIYDVELKFEWSGKASDGTEVEGKLQVPEVSHEITLDRLHDYVVRPIS